MDCLDRTNVVQSVISRKILHLQLFQLKQVAQPEGSPFELFHDEQLETVFRNVWTDHADSLSVLYSGTPALKTDFTRTGKRTYYGAMLDLKNSAMRYYINNFCDGYNHDCLDLAQSKLVPTPHLAKRPRFQIQSAVVSLLGVVAATPFLVDHFYPQQEPYSHFALYLSVLSLGSLMIYINGKNFVDEASRFVV